MKVFEVITEHYPTNSKAVETSRQYVTTADDSLQTVVSYFTAHCTAYEESLKGVNEVLIIALHID